MALSHEGRLPTGIILGLHPKPTIPEDILDEPIRFTTVYSEPEDDDDEDGDLFRPMVNVVPDPLPPFLPISRLEPPATVSPSEGVLVDCGMMPSLLHPPGQRPSRPQIPSPQGPEQGKVGGGDRQTGVGGQLRFPATSAQASGPHSSQSAYQQKPGEFPAGTIPIDSIASEVSPYISPSSSSSGYGSHSHSSIDSHRAVASSTKPSPPRDDQPFHIHGWVEYLLPDESLYYVHNGYQLVADMDLNNEKLLDGVMAYLQDHCDIIPPGQELWLRESIMRSREGIFVPLRWLVDHTKRSVMFYPSHETNNHNEGHSPQCGCEDDRLDAKYRYWSFMEAHPAHTSLPPAAYQDAMDALHWASTNRLINSHPSCSTPHRSLRKNARVSPPSFYQSINGGKRLSARTQSRKFCSGLSVGANPTSVRTSHYLQMLAVLPCTGRTTLRLIAVMHSYL
ncbi:hypothetical protein BD779DRAFT_1786330 [Infundibulicybe gibba]|nr:hypothetical protein BD779DRAFT_1786330 [Infundibulicybe gibba]